MLRTFTVFWLMALSLIAVFPRMVHATEWYDWDHRQVRHASHHRAHHFYREPVVRVDHDDGHCKDKVRGLGTQWIGTKGALDAAKKDFMERVRYDFGEKFVDLANARDFESRCSRVSIGEVAGQVTYRCEITARPCKAWLKDDPDAIAKDRARAENQEDLRDERERRDSHREDR